MIQLSLVTVYEVTGVLPKVTADAPVKPDPMTFTEVPPAVVPVTGEMLTTVGVEITSGVNTWIRYYRNQRHRHSHSYSPLYPQDS